MGFFFFFFFGFLINCVDGGSMRYFYFFVQCWFFILINCVGVLVFTAVMEVM